MYIYIYIYIYIYKSVKNIVYLMYIFMCAYNIISILWACVREGKYIYIYIYIYICMYIYI